MSAGEGQILELAGAASASFLNTVWFLGSHIAIRGLDADAPRDLDGFVNSLNRTLGVELEMESTEAGHDRILILRALLAGFEEGSRQYQWEIHDDG